MAENDGTHTTASTQTSGGVVYDVTTTRSADGRVIGGTATPR
jgi:hypothetical protein